MSKKIAKHYVAKREVTVLKIEMASEAIRKENDRRRKHNDKREKLLKKGKAAPEALTILSPTFVHTARKTPKRMPLYTRGVHTIVHSNKRLCGYLGLLCEVLKSAHIKYPWMEEANA